MNVCVKRLHLPTQRQDVSLWQPALKLQSFQSYSFLNEMHRMSKWQMRKQARKGKRKEKKKKNILYANLIKYFRQKLNVKNTKSTE